MKTSRVLRIVFLPIVLGCVGSAFSQSSTGSISGTVTDQNNAVVVGATVFGKNTATGFVRRAVTNSSGLYRLTDIPLGPYEITIEAASFKKLERGGITLDVGQNVTVDAILEPGGIAESVTINENASMLNSSTAEVRTRFDTVDSLNCRSPRTVVFITQHCPHRASSSWQPAKRISRNF